MRLEKILILAIMILGAMSIISTVYAYPAEQVNWTLTAVQYNNTVHSVQNIVAQGGNVSEVNFSQTRQTTNWQLFFGMVSARVTLGADRYSSGNLFTQPYTAYDWGNFTPSIGFLMFSNNSNVDWTTVDAADTTDTWAEDQTLGWWNVTNGREAIDAVNRTYDANTWHQTIYIDGSVGDGIIAADAAVAAHSRSSTAFNWTQVLLNDATTGAAIHTAVINTSGVTNFFGNESHYQIMVPTSKTSNFRTYYVFAALGEYKN